MGESMVHGWGWGLLPLRGHIFGGGPLFGIGVPPRRFCPPPHQNGNNQPPHPQHYILHGITIWVYHRPVVILRRSWQRWWRSDLLLLGPAAERETGRSIGRRPYQSMVGTLVFKKKPSAGCVKKMNRGWRFYSTSAWVTHFLPKMKNWNIMLKWKVRLMTTHPFISMH